MPMLIRVLKIWKVLIEDTYKKVLLIAINHELTHENHAINR